MNLGERSLILGTAHLRAVLAEYQEHYNAVRPHPAIWPAHPRHRAPSSPRHHRGLPHPPDPPKPVLSGLINEYERAA